MMTNGVLEGGLVGTECGRVPQERQRSFWSCQVSKGVDVSGEGPRLGVLEDSRLEQRLQLGLRKECWTPAGRALPPELCSIVVECGAWGFLLHKAAKSFCDTRWCIDV